MGELNTYSDKVHELIAMELSGDLSEADSALFNEWLAESTSNRSYFESQKEIWAAAQSKFTVDVDAAWNKVDARTSQHTTPRPIKVVKIFPKTYAIFAAAASVAILVMVNFLNNTDQIMTINAAIDTHVELPDSSNIELRHGATLAFEETMSGQTREVTLSGEAFFKVARDESKPFIIHTSLVDVEVLGTSFFIRENNGSIEVEVVSGKVRELVTKINQR